MQDINSALLSNKTNASQDERNIPHAEDGGMAAKHPINSFHQLKVHTETPESTSVPRNIETDVSNIRRELKVSILTEFSFPLYCSKFMH